PDDPEDFDDFQDDDGCPDTPAGGGAKALPGEGAEGGGADLVREPVNREPGTGDRERGGMEGT
ncbi:MAG: hypothetical protein QME96_16950, partial [Myxococcota bacterium]|nr:hypothetical protein [Myxococcota bacterium]